MKKFLLMAIITSLAIFLFGCGSSEKKPAASSDTKPKEKVEDEEKDSGKKDFEVYLKEVQPILSEVGSVYAKDYESVRQKSANGEITDEEFGTTIAQDILPKGVKLSEKVQALMPPKELRGMHEILIDMVSKSHQAMSELVAAVDNGDASKITSANNLLSESSKLERDYVYELQDMANKYNIELPK